MTLSICISPNDYWLLFAVAQVALAASSCHGLIDTNRIEQSVATLAYIPLIITELMISSNSYRLTLF